MRTSNDVTKVITIRPANLNDRDIILDFMADYYEIDNLEYDRDLSRVTLKNLIENDQLGLLYLIQSPPEVVGYFCVAFSYTLQYHGKDCFLDEIYIKPGFRHQGIGTKVMKYIENYLETNNFNAIHLLVFDHNPAAFGYYTKNGFQAHKASFMTKIMGRK